MTDEKKQTLQLLTDETALPPLKMSLIQKQDNPTSKPFEAANVPSIASQEHLEVQTVKKIIEHLEQRA